MSDYCKFSNAYWHVDARSHTMVVQILKQADGNRFRTLLLMSLKPATSHTKQHGLLLALTWHNLCHLSSCTAYTVHVRVYHAFSAFALFAGRKEEHPAHKKVTDEVLGWFCGRRSANDSHMAQLMPLPPHCLCFSKIQNGFPAGTDLPSCPKNAVKQVLLYPQVQHIHCTLCVSLPM